MKYQLINFSHTHEFCREYQSRKVEYKMKSRKRYVVEIETNDNPLWISFYDKERRNKKNTDKD